MNLNQEFNNQVFQIFKPLNKRNASKAIPPPAQLSESLGNLVGRAGTTSWNLEAKLASYFATAAIDIWFRGIHSFLISTSLTDASPIWASVSGYYSSHYAIRGIAHLLGYFHLYKKSRTAKLQIDGKGRYVCKFLNKPSGSGGGEHKLYWVLVKRDPIFQADNLFTENSQDQDLSDIGHRNFANYIDHISRYPTFHPLDKESLRIKIDHISKIILDDVPIPRRSKFPDVEYVQLVAYRRIVCFRKILDEILSDTSRFWNVHRTPSFASEFMDFQLTESSGLTQLNSL